MGDDFPTEEMTCAKCGQTMRVEVRAGDFHHWTDCDAGEQACRLIKDAVGSHEGQAIDVSVTDPE